MKLRIYFRPSLVVLLLGIVAGLSWLAVALSRGAFLVVLALSTFYTVLFALSAWALWRSHVLERWARWDSPERLLILAPHEDDCVISAGGIGARNSRLGGVTRIIYLAPDETPGMAERRAAEAAAAWRLAGLGKDDLLHVDLLPPLRQRNPSKLRTAAAALRSIVDEFNPSVIVMPMFEGGHIHHDMVAAVMRTITTAQDQFDMFEAPEYGPYVSLNYTPHRIIALSARWLFGLVSYYGPPDGVDGRPIVKFRLDQVDLDCKRRMLAAFASQNAPALIGTRSYPDRLVPWQRGSQRRAPFDFAHSYLRFVMAVRNLLPPAIVDRLLPVQLGTVGREGALTDWWEEWSPMTKEAGKGGCSS
jgi:LmbE family N-acetylglucosaminyl deacetylase